MEDRDKSSKTKLLNGERVNSKRSEKRLGNK